jgi:hypothetical protein
VEEQFPERRGWPGQVEKRRLPPHLHKSQSNRAFGCSPREPGSFAASKRGEAWVCLAVPFASGMAVGFVLHARSRSASSRFDSSCERFSNFPGDEEPLLAALEHRNALGVVGLSKGFG